MAALLAVPSLVAKEIPRLRQAIREASRLRSILTINKRFRIEAMNKNVIHYSGHGVPGMLAGWPVCRSGDFAYKVREEGNHTAEINSVTCKRCLKKMEGTRAEQKRPEPISSPGVKNPYQWPQPPAPPHGRYDLGRDKNILFGILLCLQDLYSHDEEVIYREMMDKHGHKDLLTIAKEEEALEWSGLIHYGYCDSLGRYTPNKLAKQTVNG